MNFIDTIEIKNFKSIRHQKIEGCKRVNVFIGYPNVGKSNILEGIGLYSVTQQVNQERFPFNSICRVNHFSDLYFDKNVQEKMIININGKYILSVQKENSYSEFGINIQSVGEGMSVFETSIGEKYNFQSFSSVKEAMENAVIYKIKYYRFESDNDLNKTKSPSLSIPDGDNLIDILQGNASLRKEYSSLLSLYSLKLNISDSNAISVAKELSDGTFVSFPNNLVSDTLRRLFFYKAAIQTNKNSVLLFEEPEAHMFPPYISKLTGDIMYDENKNQFFVATHSPYVLNDFISDLDIEELALFIVTYDKRKGETIIHRMSDSEVNEAYQFGYDFFMNINQFIQKQEHE